MITEEQLAEWEAKTMKLIECDEAAAKHPPGHSSRMAIEYLVGEVRRQREEIDRLYVDLRTEQAKIVHTEIRSFPACNSSDKP